VERRSRRWNWSVVGLHLAIRTQLHAINVAERGAWAPLNPDGVADPSGPGRSNELAGKTCISSPAIRARGGTYAADSARSIASGSLSITVRRIREGVSMLERPCSQSRTRATENP